MRSMVEGAAEVQDENAQRRRALRSAPSRTARGRMARSVPRVLTLRTLRLDGKHGAAVVLSLQLRRTLRAFIETKD